MTQSTYNSVYVQFLEAMHRVTDCLKMVLYSVCLLAMAS
jgi:hypothetical protein